MLERPSRNSTWNCRNSNPHWYNHFFIFWPIGYTASQ